MSRRFTASALLGMALPGLPKDKGALSRLIAREGWRNSPLARQGATGWEYHVSLLPAEAQADLLVREAAAERSAAGAAWEAYEALPDRAKDEARYRLAAVDQLVGLKAGGMGVSTAVGMVARRTGVSSSTLWNWLDLVAGKDRHDWLAALAPRRVGRTATADCDPRAWDFLVADYLRPERPSFAACYRRLQETAATRGWGPIPAAKTLQRRLEKLPAGARALARGGRDAVQRMYPHQTRDRHGFAAMEAVNADGHRFDVFVRWEDGSIGRPVGVVIQDLGTGMILAHRLAQSESWTAVRLAFADMIEVHGIPDQCWLDNGRAFATKLLTGGTPNRYRFKIREDEPAGILTSLGIKIHWATPYHGQAKPIERAFRDLCEEIAKHPAAAGAYTGNSPDAKPENYGSRAMPIADFRALVASEIDRHNARTGRRGAVARGLSFAAAFSASISAPGTVIRRASAAQRRLLLLAAEGVTARRPTGEVQLGGNRYWHEALTEHMGSKLIVRFDPDNLHAPVAVYALDGRFICEAEPIEATGFADSEAARVHARDRRAWVKAQKSVLDIERRLGIDDVAALLPRITPVQPPEAPVVRLVTESPQRAAAREGDELAAQSFSRAVRAAADEDASTSNRVIPFREAGTG